MTLDLTIGGMTCVGCARHVTTALERVDGVQTARIDYLAGRAQVELAPGLTTTPTLTSALVTAVERAGYRAAQIMAHTPSFAGEAPTRAVPVDAFSSNADGGDASSTADFDLLILGTGGAGVAAAIQAAGTGAKVGIVERGLLGGTCVNVGCIPSKMLLEAAAHVHAARRGFPGVAPCEPAVDWREVVRQKDALVKELREAKYADVLASYPGVVRLSGHARLLANEDGVMRVRVDAAGAGRVHTARKVIVATGAAATLPSIPGLDSVDALDSTSAMALSALPASIIVLGGGPVAVELGQMFARFGVRVVLVQRRTQLLPGEDPEIAAVLREALEAEGMEIHTSTTATRVERDGAEVVVHITQGKLAGQLRAAHLLVATGRRPNTRDLGLEDVGVMLLPTGHIQTDATLCTANPNVYAAGDVTGGPGYVYVAAAGGRLAAENALKALHGAGTASDAPREFDLTAVPSVTFTAPQVASVGLTETAARAAGYHVDVSVLEMAHVPRALVSYDRRGLVKLVSESGSGRVLGVHAVAPNAGEFMGEATLAVRFGLTVRDLSGTLHPYLTWVESLKLAAQGGSMGVAKLSCCA